MQLFLFREGRRDNAVMTAAAKGLSDADLRSRQAPFSKAASERARPGPHEARPAGNWGQKLHELPRTRLRRPQQRAAGRQPTRGLSIEALRDYRSGVRVGYGNALMPETVAGLDDAQLADIAHYLSHLK
jgi:cytochrome c553